MIVLGYNGFTRGAELFGRLYGARGIDRNLLVGHDAAAALVIDGEVVAAVEEERLSRVKKTSDFPVNAINWCLESAGVELDQVDVFAFPWRFSATVGERMISRICDTDLSVPAKFDALRRTGELYTGMLGPDAVYDDFVRRTGHELDPNKLALVPHHLAHLMCGAYLAGGGDAAFLVSDGRAETLSSVMGELCNGVVRVFDDSAVDMTSSLAVAYGRITRYLGFVPNNDEYKVMGLAAYGPPPGHNPLLERVVRLHENGSYTVSVPRDCDAYYALFDDLFGGDSEKREEFDFRVKVAGFAQHMVEAVTAHQLRALTAASELDHLLFEGGLALNCVANTKMLERSSFTGMDVSFGASDPGVAIGAAVYTAGLRNRPADAVTTPYLGPSYDEQHTLDALAEYADRVEWQEEPDGASVADRTAELLAQKNVVGWFQGRTEFGPRALGNRSILANPAFPDIKDIINVRVKHREPFRPFAPVVLTSEAPRVFEMGKKTSSPYMTFVFPVREEYRERIPGACHVDGTARVQTVDERQNPALAELLRAFTARTDVPCLLNTSFNVAGEPIVCSPRDALECFLATEIDYLVIDRFVVTKRDR
ncbi:carbamoyltransferase C-terminal domain-containing protein [Streptomyces aurantiacus]|uniref:Putative Nodulation protein NolNO n=1 Tax=Streptomyces aurantiacus JA 4570 TaxID=1286094 RepID=S3ZND2_9ACTN|nr:carbamoyltransferase C-terminal domain-containing protein [Streptomyces aurantiacus]EPH44683.1 putative Nodulation protein NolNO [Streptomyces aurantiacus JA 4570]